MPQICPLRYSFPEFAACQTRSIDSCAIFSNDDVVQCVKFEDGTFECAWPMGLDFEKTPKQHWLPEDQNVLSHFPRVPKDLDNLLTADSYIKGAHEAFVPAHITAQFFEMGHTDSFYCLFALA